MKIIKLVLVLAFFCTAYGLTAQDLNQAQRYLKVGNTLREAKQYSEAERYIIKGKEAVEKLNNRYWMAVAYENLGLLNRDRLDNRNAVFYFKKAGDIYKTVGSQTSSTVVRQMLSGLNNETSDIFGGIEIGSKGVKLSVVAVKYSAAGAIQFSIEKSDDIITNAVSGSDEAFRETVRGVKVYLDTLMIRRKLGEDHIFIVGSSGLNNGLRKMAESKVTTLKGMIESEIKSRWTKPVDFIDASTEARLTIQGTLPESEWNTTATLDIGSGNSKGGYFTDKDFKYVDFLGTATFTSLIEKKQGTRSFGEACKAIMEDEVKSYQISEQLGRFPAFQSRNKLYLLGGIVYAVTTYLHPEQLNKREVAFTYNEVKRFREMAISQYARLTDPDLSDIDNEKLMKASQKAIKKLREETFSQNQLIAGSTLLLGIMEETRKSNESEKAFVFNRDGYIGWISGYIKEAITKMYEKSKEI